MLGDLLLLAALLFGIVAVFSRDNVYSASSLAVSAGAVGAYYAYLGQFAPALLIFVIYIGAVMLLVIVTAAMYGGVHRWGARRIAASTVLLAATALAALFLQMGHREAVGVLQGVNLAEVAVLLFSVAALSLIVGVEIARRS
ncbi:hypothetical protein [Pyrobaculum neutrophilum]|nr:hypothetical protein [Pyrobaculum neutrophilum]